MKESTRNRLLPWLLRLAPVDLKIALAQRNERRARNLRLDAMRLRRSNDSYERMFAGFLDDEAAELSDRAAFIRRGLPRQRGSVGGE